MIGNSAIYTTDWVTNDAIYLVTTSSTKTVSYPVAQTMQNNAWQNLQTIQMIQTPWYDSHNWVQDRWLAGQMGNYNPASTIYYHGLEELTPEEKAKLAEREAKRKAADRRAENLLFSILTPTQVKQYTDDDCFEVPVGERLYRLRKGRSMNVELIEAGKPTIKYCAHPVNAYTLPVPDVMLSQLLALKANEAEFLRIANRTVLQ